jgi:hypothetical protein
VDRVASADIWKCRLVHKRSRTAHEAEPNSAEGAAKQQGGALALDGIGACV